METVGEIIKDLRKRRGWTQARLAEASGVAQSFISALESGAKEATTSTLQQIANAFELPIQSLFPENRLSLVSIERLLPKDVRDKLKSEDVIPYLILAVRAKDFEITPERLRQIIDLIRRQ